jgi:hypothetical protein
VDGGDQTFQVVLREPEPGFRRDHIRNVRMRAGHDRQSRGLSLENGVGCAAFGVAIRRGAARLDQQVGTEQERGRLGVAATSEEAHPPFHTLALRQLHELPGQRPISDYRQNGLGHASEHADRQVDALLVHEASDL